MTRSQAAERAGAIVAPGTDCEENAMFTSFENDVYLGGEALVAHARPVRPREPHTLPESGARRSPAIGRHVRAHEDAWAMHANAASGFGAGETAT